MLRIRFTIISQTLCLITLLAASVGAQSPASDDTAPAASDQSSTAPPSSSSQAPVTPSLERQFFRNILRDQRAIWTSPFHLGKGNHWRLIAIGSTTVALLLTDEHTAARLGDNPGRFRISNNVSKVGSWYGIVGVTGAFYLVGRTTGNAKARETGVLCAEALIDSLIVGQALKVITQRKRPLDQPGEAHFFNGGAAFPSGHSVNAWAIASVIAHEYDNLPVQLSAYALAGLVSVSRFTGRRHYLSDIFVGGAIGYGIGRYVHRAHHDATLDANAQQAGSRHGNWRPAVSPIFSRANREYGLSLTWGL